MAADLFALYQALRAHFGHRHWWPGDTPWEITVGAVLTQNTNWRNVERAIAALQARGVLDPAAIQALPLDELAALIRPAGYFNVKARRLHAVAQWFRQHATAASDPTSDLTAARTTLLAVHGVGPETADSILLYACGRPTFVVDAYTRRVVTRHRLLPARATYAEIQAWFTRALPADVPLYNDYHAQLVEVGKHYCRPQPRCAECPLRWHLAGRGPKEE